MAYNLERKGRGYDPRKVFIKISWPFKTLWTVVYFDVDNLQAEYVHLPDSSMTLSIESMLSVIELIQAGHQKIYLITNRSPCLEG